MGSHFGMEGKISKFVKDRERFEELEKIPQNIPSLKASLFPPLRYVLEKYIGIPESMTGLKADEVLQKHDISTIIKILENHEAYFELEKP